MGLSFEAFRAGATPKTIPTIADTPNAKLTDQKDTDAGKNLLNFWAINLQ